MGAAIRYRNTNIPRQTGEQARLKVVRGPDEGSVFVVTGGRVTIGRGEDNDIVLMDLKASRKHAELVQVGGSWMFRDLGSSNGVQLNGKAVREGQLAPSDTLVVGQTVFELATADQSTSVLSAPGRLALISGEGTRASATRTNVTRTATLTSAVGGTKKKDPKLLLIGVLGVGAFLMFGMEEKKPTPSARKEDKPLVERSLASYLPETDNPALVRSVDMFMKSGLREFRLGNFLRAKTQFETVLQMKPGDPLARIYSENCDIEIKNEVGARLAAGKKAVEVGRVKEARGHFEAVMRLLFRNQADENFLEAKEALEALQKAGSS